MKGIAEAEDYLEFLAKFEAKKTTDDCYTPANIYAAVLNWATNEYGLQGREIVRPFHPESDYQKAEYPAGCVVIDNPPFSILSEIVRWYEWKGIDYFLFAPNLTLFSPDAKCAIISDSNVIYTNGAEVKTSFLTSLDTCKIRTAPELHYAIKEANDANRAKQVAELPKYTYPENVISAALLNKIAKAELKIMPEQVSPLVHALEHQKRHGKTIFGAGYIISDDAAAAIKAAAIKAAAIKCDKERFTWELEAPELEILRKLNSNEPMPTQKAFEI